jgi:hypothetical protein
MQLGRSDWDFRVLDETPHLKPLGGTYPVPLPYMAFFTALLYVACSFALLVVYSVLYFFVKLLT